MSVEELVKELRQVAAFPRPIHKAPSLMEQAADKLEELAAENERLRRELSATTAERKRAQEACQQISENTETALAEAKRENEALREVLKKDPHSVWWRDYYEWLEARNAGGNDAE